ncbi:hypothetical protein FYB76_07585 [Herbaspirillum sp. CAH-3]|nr:hypothetical protein [Herbaspirillum sp. CAH-3]
MRRSAIGGTGPKVVLALLTTFDQVTTGENGGFVTKKVNVAIENALTTFPGGSKSRVNRAGNNVRAGTASREDLAVIEEWRAAHRAVLNTFQAILHKRARNKGVIVDLLADLTLSI